MDKRRIAEQILTIVCDDIRHEMGGKVSLMGIYDEVNVIQAPTILPKINLAIIIRKTKIEIKKIKVDLIRPDGDTIDLPEFNSPLGIPIGSTHNMDICVAPLKVDTAGKYVWEVRINGSEKPSFTHEMVINAPSQAKQKKNK